MHRGLFLCVIGVALAGVAAFAGYRFVFPSATSPGFDPGPSAADDSSKVLDDDEKAYLWDIEHHGNLLTSGGFSALTKALIQADRAGLERCLAANFAASEPSSQEPVRLHTDYLDVERLSAVGQSPRALSRSDFLERLLKWRKLFSAPPKAKLALMALSPVERGNLAGPWQGTGQLRVWGRAENDKPAEVIAYVSYRIRPPTEENLKAGGWLLACDVTQVQVGTARHFLLQEVAAKRGIDPKQFHDNWKENATVTNTGGVYACDFNRDGWIDLLVTDINGVYLYQGLPGGKFRNVTVAMGLSPTLPGGNHVAPRATFVDLDNDGWEDLILGDQVYRNDKGQRFVSMREECNLWLPENYSTIVPADFDRDGLVDLYITRSGPPLAGSWLTGKSGEREGNYLFRNKGNWQFEDVTRAAGVHGDQRSTFTAAWLDANNDGWPDLYLINEFGDGVLYENMGRTGSIAFRQHLLAKGPCDFGAMGVAVGDVDNDGHIDIYSGNMYSKAGSRVIANVRPGTYPEEVMARVRTFVTGSQLHRNLGDFHFEQLGKAWQVNDCGWAYGPALVDLDNDGFLDLYATCGFISRTRDEPDG